MLFAGVHPRSYGCVNDRADALMLPGTRRYRVTLRPAADADETLRVGRTIIYGYGGDVALSP